MTIEEKLAEADFFRNMLNEACNDKSGDQIRKLFEIRCYYSAYLSSSISVYDYVLYHANRVFNLGLQDEEYWDNKKFRKEAEEKDNKDALNFIEWFDSRVLLEKEMIIGNAFAKSRRINTHKRSTYTIGFDPKVTKIGKKADGSPDPELILMDPNIFLMVEGFEQLKIDDACDTHFSTMQKFVEDSYEQIERIQTESIAYKKFF